MDCDAETVQAQESAIQMLRKASRLIDYDNLTYPLTLYYIGLCNGETLWVMESELSYFETAA